MVEINTRIFGKIAIEEEKIIRFESGILGFPQLKEFTLIYNAEKGNDSGIKWLQSIQEPAFAMPVMNPELAIHQGLTENCWHLLAAIWMQTISLC